MGTRKVANFKKGDRVAVMCINWDGQIEFEGWAVVLGKSADGRRDTNRVRFEKDGYVADRWIDPMAQDDPIAHAKRINDEALSARKALHG